MKITGLEYSRTWNVGPYESETIKAYASLDENVNPASELKELKKFVMAKGETELAEASPAASVSKKQTKAVVETTAKPDTHAKEVETKKEVETPKAEVEKEVS